MKKLIYLAVIGLLLISCEKKQRTMDDMRREALESGIVDNIIFDSLSFGMSPQEVNRILPADEKGVLHYVIPELSQYNFNVYPNFYNDSLYQLWLSIYETKERPIDFELIANTFEKIYQKPDTVIVVNKFKVSYWYKGNQIIQLNEDHGDYQGVTLNYFDQGRKMLSTCRLVTSEVNNYDRWTIDYYENVYQPSRKQEMLNSGE